MERDEEFSFENKEDEIGTSTKYVSKEQYVGELDEWGEIKEKQ